MTSYKFYEEEQLLGFLACFPGQCNLLNVGSTLTKEILFFKSLSPNEIGGKKENDRFASPESEPIHINVGVTAPGVACD